MNARKFLNYSWSFALLLAVIFFILEIIFLLNLSTGFLDFNKEISIAISGTLLTSLITAYFLDKRFQTNNRFCFLALFSCSFFPIHLIKPIQDYQNKITTNRLQLIVQRITIFKQKNGTYPPNLTSLNSEFKNRIPKPFIGLNAQAFKYNRKNNEYTLEYYAFNGFTYGYSSKTNQLFGYD